MRPSMRFAAFLALGAVVAAAPPAAAEEHEVSQREKVFEPGEITVKQGDTVTFLNDDEVSHNVFSRSEGDRFNLKFQKPGEHKSHVFEEPGTKVIRCAIHPKMKLVVEVEPSEAPAAADAAGAADAAEKPDAAGEADAAVAANAADAEDAANAAEADAAAEANAAGEAAAAPEERP